MAQLIVWIKTVVLPMSEFLLRHINLSLPKLQNLNDDLRKLINEKTDSLPKLKNLFSSESGMAVLDYITSKTISYM
jgi:hypothetical protein